MQFHGMNLPMCSALTVLLQSVKLDLTCMNERDCLLTIDRSVFPPIENHLNLAGVYNFEDKLRGIFNRAGKAEVMKTQPVVHSVLPTSRA